MTAWDVFIASKLPGTEKQARVLFDWLLDLVFPRDIVVTAGPQARSGPPTRGAQKGQDR